MELFKSKKGTVGQKLSTLMQSGNLGNDVTEQRTVVIKGLAVVLGDDPSAFFTTSSKTSMDETVEPVVLGVLTTDDFDASSSNAETFHNTVVIEGSIVMNISDLLQAFCLVFALIYALNLYYPKSVHNTFKFIQSVMLGLGKHTTF